MPFLITGLIIMKFNYESINFQLIIGIIILMSAFVRILKIGINTFTKKKKLFSNPMHILIGLIHGITNMGGSFLSMYASSIYPNNKYNARYIVGFAYLIMGIVQFVYINLFFSIKFDYFVILYGLLSLATYSFIGNRAFKLIKNKTFNNLVNYIIALYGFILIFRNL